MVAVDYFHSRESCSRFACVYFPPQNSINLTLTTNLVKTLTKLISKQRLKTNLFLLGDFNFSDIDWKNSDSQRNQGVFKFSVIL